MFKVEGEPGNIIFVIVVTVLTITCRGLELGLLFLDINGRKICHSGFIWLENQEQQIKVSRM